MNTIAEDMHVHSQFSDGRDDIAANVRAAEEVGLHRLCCVDHVRRETAWVPDFVRAVRTVAQTTTVKLYCGVEAKLLNEAGELDIPERLDGIDFVYVADHQLPLGKIALPPQDVRRLLKAGVVRPERIIEGLVRATLRALDAPHRIVLAHLFSILPKMGLDENDVPVAAIDALARKARERGAMLEIDERWRCPNMRTLALFAAHDVPILQSTDSHRKETIGRYEHVLAVHQVLQLPKWQEAS